MTPSRFIRTIGLQRAALLLEADAGNVSEIDSAVGSADPKYFCKLLRLVFDTVYVYRIEAGGFSATRRMLLLNVTDRTARSSIRDAVRDFG